MAFLRAQRRSVLAFVDGLDEEATQQTIVPSGWTPSGMIEHLAHAEHFWFQQVLAGRDEPPPWSAPEREDNDGAGFHSMHRLPAVRAIYQEQCGRSDTVLVLTSLEARPSGEAPPEIANGVRSARSIILRMIEETARHASHLDIARELIDGRTGLGPR